MPRLPLGILLAAIALFAPPFRAAMAASYDVVLKNGRVVDGTGAPWYLADIGIRDGIIVRIGRIPADAGAQTLDVSGLIVAPGFIDMMGQTISPCLEDPKAALNLLTQGITTVNAGEGASAAPLDDNAAKTAGWQSMAEYFAVVEEKGIPVNVAQTVGHTQVRRIVLGDVDRRPTPEELERMQDLVREAMEAGAIGVSTALIYPPAVYATTEEIAALARVAGEYGGRYYTHMRNEGDRLLEAIDEALEIGRAAGTPVHIFHLKAAGRQNWGKMDQALARIKAARASGEQVTADIYPYINNGLGIAAFIHPRHFTEGYDKLRRRLDDPELQAEIRREMETVGGWENWYRHIENDWSKVVLGSISDEQYRVHEGKSLAEIAEAMNEAPWDTFFHIARSGAFALPQSMSDANKIKAMQEGFISFCTDVGPAGGTRIATHPRAFGSFPRLLSRYVRDLGVLTLEQAVAQMTATAANELMAYDRGRIAVGLAADLVVFDFDAIDDRATLADPDVPSVGVEHVLVNGELVLHKGQYTGAKPGKVLRGPGYRRPEDGPLRSFDRMMKSFMDEHDVPGGALAVTANGKLVYARGFGYAGIEAGERVQPTSLFRIASLSKPITAVAVLQLVEQGRLDLDSRVFDVLTIDDSQPKSAARDPRLKGVTIRHLLQHTGGWDRDASFDPMFQSVRFSKALGIAPPAGPRDVIRAMLGQPLDFEPGQRYAYSNFGYCLLGRVIETLTKQPYEEHVRTHVLAPLGIRDMRIGKTRLEGRAPGEVRYYDERTGSSVFADDLGQDVPQPYGAWYLEAMDSHGGWIASAVDLARFTAAFDDPKTCPILKPETIAVMFARPEGMAGYTADEEPKPTYYACGWSVRPVGTDGKFNSWHTGSLPGTATLLVRRHDGKNWAVLFNARSGNGVSHLARAIDGLVHQAADEVESWPEVDLFEAFE